VPAHAARRRLPSTPPRLTVAFFIVLIATSVPRGADAPIRLVDVTQASGLGAHVTTGTPIKDYIVDTNGNGAAWFDYDNDSDLDALIVQPSTLERLADGGDPMVALYRNDGDGMFADVTAGSRLTRRGWGTGVCVADYNNDGFEDVYITAFGPNVLWRNRGDGTFSATTQAADRRWSTGCAFGDYDRDGFVDLYVANYLRFDRKTVPARGAPQCRFMDIDAVCGPRPLPGEPDALYRNVGNGTFADVTKAAGATEPGHYGFGVLFSDLDDDGWPDIYVANDSTPNLFFRNRGDGTFADEALQAGVAVSADGREQAGMGVDAGDYDGDGRLDLVKTNFAQDYTSLYRNEGEGLFVDDSHRSGLAATIGTSLGWGVGFVDVDNDGLLDLFIANGHVFPDVARTGTSTYRQKNQLFRNAGRGRFRHVTAEVNGGGLSVEQSSRGAAFGDYDNDGDIDILVVNIDEGPTLLRNDTIEDAHWITLHLEGTTSNRDAIGARVTVEADGRQQVAEVRSGGSYLSHNDMRLHFGLGEASVVDRLTIRWSSGLVETSTGLATRRFYKVREGTPPFSLSAITAIASKPGRSGV
jgi:enediyne biosynthesis protein E4